MRPQYTPQDTPSKRCPRCKEEKPATTDYFYPSKSRKSGLEVYCKACEQQYRHANKEKRSAREHEYYLATKERRKDEEHKKRAAEAKRRYRAKNKEKIAEYERVYRTGHKEQIAERTRQNRERINERERLWRINNKDKVTEKERRYRATHKEKISEKNRRWRINNKEASRAKDTRRRARKLAADGYHTAADVQRQYKAQKGKCYYCKCKVGSSYHVDHIIPLSRGGSNGPENIVIACQPCNQSKKDKMPHEWPQGGRLL